MFLKTYLSLVLIPFWVYSQHTFSIVAVDTSTGEVGSAGASCIDINNSHNINRISKLVPGRGAINAQAWWNFENLDNGELRIIGGDSPQEVIDWLVQNDAANDPQRMQYGVVDISPSNQPRAAGFSGTKGLDYKNHNVGQEYAIQGNVLIGQHVLDSMENKYLNSTGSLSDRLMATLQGANFAGADRRCLDEGTSSKSSYIRVAKPTDVNINFYLDLGVSVTPYGVEPIDELQTIYDNWKSNLSANNKSGFSQFESRINNISIGSDIRIEWIGNVPNFVELKIISLNGSNKFEYSGKGFYQMAFTDYNNNSGIHFIEIIFDNGNRVFTKKFLTRLEF